MINLHKKINQNSKLIITWPATQVKVPSTNFYTRKKSHFPRYGIFQMEFHMSHATYMNDRGLKKEKGKRKKRLKSGDVGIVYNQIQMNNSPLIQFANANSDISISKPPLQFDSLGKYHLEFGSTPPSRDINACIRLEAYRDKQMDHKQNTMKKMPECVTVPGEDLWNCTDARKNTFAINLNQMLEKERVLTLLGDAGSGKSYYAREIIKMNPNWRYLVICPYGHLLVDTWKAYEAITDCKALGLVIEGGEVNQKKSPINFDEIDFLIIDEAYLISLDNLFRLYTHIRRNSNMRVLILGDVLQNEAINKLAYGDTMLIPYSSVIQQALTKIAPHFVNLEINKRMFQDHHRLNRIKQDLFNPKAPLSPAEVVRYLAEEKLIGGLISSFDDIKAKNIDHHLAYSNKYSVALNSDIHKELFKQREEFDLWDGTFFVKRNFLSYKIGDIITPKIVGDRIVVGDSGDSSISYSDALKIWKEYGEMLTHPLIEQLLEFFCQERGIYILRKHHDQLIINTHIKLVWKPKNKNDKYTFLNHEGKRVSVVQSFVDKCSVRYPYCRTGHSTQGSTIPNRYVIHMYESQNLCSKNWFWTCVTRAQNLKNIYVRILPKLETTEAQYKANAEHKLQHYVQTDRAKGRTGETYDVGKMTEMLMFHHYKRCQGLLNRPCDNMLSVECGLNESMSFDRVNNNLGHGIGNLRVVCLHCNRRAKDSDDAV